LRNGSGRGRLTEDVVAAKTNDFAAKILIAIIRGKNYAGRLAASN